MIDGTWAWDDRTERARVEQEYGRMIHQQFLDDNPAFIPGCPCHPMTRAARLELRELKAENLSWFMAKSAKPSQSSQSSQSNQSSHPDYPDPSNHPKET